MAYGMIDQVNGYLIDMMNAVTEDDLDSDELESRLKKAKAVSDLSQQVIANGKLALEAAKVAADYCRPSDAPSAVAGLLGTPDDV